MTRKVRSVHDSVRSPWPLDGLAGVVLGSHFDESTSITLGLHLDSEATQEVQDDYRVWSGEVKGQYFGIYELENRVIGISCHGEAVIKGLNLIGLSWDDVRDLIGEGAAAYVDGDLTTVDYVNGTQVLVVSFRYGVSQWVTLNDWRWDADYEQPPKQDL